MPILTDVRAVLLSACGYCCQQELAPSCCSGTPLTMSLLASLLSFVGFHLWLDTSIAYHCRSGAEELRLVYQLRLLFASMPQNFGWLLQVDLQVGLFYPMLRLY